MDNSRTQAVKISSQETQQAAQPAEEPVKSPSQGLAVDTIFCPVDVADPFDTVEWDSRTAAIKGEQGEVLFEQENCEIPATWSQLATNVVV